MEKHIIDEKTGISYIFCGNYYFPDLEIKEQEIQNMVECYE